MKCSWQTFLSPLKGQRQYHALIGLSQTTRLTGGFDFDFTKKRTQPIFYDIAPGFCFLRRGSGLMYASVSDDCGKPPDAESAGCTIYVADQIVVIAASQHAKQLDHFYQHDPRSNRKQKCPEVSLSVE